DGELSRSRRVDARVPRTGDHGVLKLDAPEVCTSGRVKDARTVVVQRDARGGDTLPRGGTDTSRRAAGDDHIAQVIVEERGIISAALDVQTNGVAMDQRVADLVLLCAAIGNTVHAVVEDLVRIGERRIHRQRGAAGNAEA